MRKRLICTCLIGLLLLSSCASQRISIYCEPQSASIYVDGHYQGDGIVHYTISRGQKYIVVSCSEDGISFVQRRFYTPHLPSSICIYLDDYKTYSSSPNTLSTH